jgi:hypothetical protein
MKFQRQIPNPSSSEYDFMDMYNVNRVTIFTAFSVNARTNVLTIAERMNKRWPDVDLFHNTYDRKNWRQWRINLIIKFR